jgi:hypothetical protein
LASEFAFITAPVFMNYIPWLKYLPANSFCKWRREALGQGPKQLPENTALSNPPISLNSSTADIKILHCCPLFLSLIHRLVHSF